MAQRADRRPIDGHEIRRCGAEAAYHAPEWCGDSWAIRRRAAVCVRLQRARRRVRRPCDGDGKQIEVQQQAELRVPPTSLLHPPAWHRQRCYEINNNKMQALAIAGARGGREGGGAGWAEGGEGGQRTGRVGSAGRGRWKG
jgi:hypothetical protein